MAIERTLDFFFKEKHQKGREGRVTGNFSSTLHDLLNILHYFYNYVLKTYKRKYYSKLLRVCSDQSSIAFVLVTANI
jgi:hypothetical protein